jgi:hypothetical protein
VTVTSGAVPAGHHRLVRVPVAGVDRSTALAGHPIHDLLPVLIRAPRVGLRFVVPDELRRPALDALGIDPLRARVGQVFLLDSPALVLTSQGVAVQALRVKGRPGRVTVTHRHLSPSRVPAVVRNAPTFTADVDVVPEGFVCAATLSGAVDDAQVRRTARGRTPVATLLTEEQRRFSAPHNADPPRLDRLVLLGPLHVVQDKARLPELDRPLRALHWFFPDGSRRVELSAGCSPDEAFDVARAVKDSLASRGLELVGDQETMVRRSLVHLVASGGAG